MPKITIITDTETARKIYSLLSDLKANRCGLRAIASTIRKLLQACKITHQD